ncbi:hypothetical protein FOA52_002222 [Chlamydomonas sp. UWO 241]|nr:hypothetical protein FOA52_002222 [Chlamydomonas sp. UWO 241]
MDGVMPQSVQKVQSSIEMMMEEIQKKHLIPKQKEAFLCCARCCDASGSNTRELQGCVERCSAGSQQAQKMIHQFMNDFQERYQRCAVRCQDLARDGLSYSGSSNELDQQKAQKKMMGCLDECGNECLGRIPNLKADIVECPCRLQLMREGDTHTIETNHSVTKPGSAEQDVKSVIDVIGVKGGIEELLDNAITAGGSRLSVRFIDNTEHNEAKLVVTDNGIGMSVEILSKYMREASTSSRLPVIKRYRDVPLPVCSFINPALNRYGKGSNVLAGLGEKYRVTTREAGENIVHISEADMDEWKRSYDEGDPGWKTMLFHQADPLVLKELRDGAKVKRLRSKIAQDYFPFITDLPDWVIDRPEEQRSKFGTELSEDTLETMPEDEKPVLFKMLDTYRHVDKGPANRPFAMYLRWVPDTLKDDVLPPRAEEEEFSMITSEELKEFKKRKEGAIAARKLLEGKPNPAGKGARSGGVPAASSQAKGKGRVSTGGAGGSSHGATPAAARSWRGKGSAGASAGAGAGGSAGAAALGEEEPYVPLTELDPNVDVPHYVDMHVMLLYFPVDNGVASKPNAGNGALQGNWAMREPFVFPFWSGRLMPQNELMKELPRFVKQTVELSKEVKEDKWFKCMGGTVWAGRQAPRWPDACVARLRGTNHKTNFTGAAFEAFMNMGPAPAAALSCEPAPCYPPGTMHVYDYEVEAFVPDPNGAMVTRMLLAHFQQVWSMLDEEGETLDPKLISRARTCTYTHVQGKILDPTVIFDSRCCQGVHEEGTRYKMAKFHDAIQKGEIVRTQGCALLFQCALRATDEVDTDAHTIQGAKGYSTVMNFYKVWMVPGAPTLFTELGFPTTNSQPSHVVARMRTITFLLSTSSGIRPDITLPEFNALWFNKDSPGGANSGTTMENYYQTCSYGKTLFTPGDNIVVDLMDTPMPAIGRTAYTNIAYDLTSTCGFAGLYAMQEWGQKQYEVSILKPRDHSSGTSRTLVPLGSAGVLVAAASHAVVATSSRLLRTGDPNAINAFQRRLVFAPSLVCPWLGLASFGCTGAFCYAWVRFDQVKRLNIIFHELGHTLQFSHSSSSTWEYGDCSCPMGCTGERACLNAPQAVRAGWYKELAVHTSANTLPGMWYRYSIPAAELTDTNTVKISPTGAPFLGNPSYYLSLKTNRGYNANIDSYFKDRLSVHTSGSSLQSDGIPPFYLGMIPGSSNAGAGYDVGSVIKEPAARLVIRFDALSPGSTFADVSFCMYTTTEETPASGTCSDGLDNDCNGLIDAADPACGGAVTPSSPPPPPTASPPPPSASPPTLPPVGSSTPSQPTYQLWVSAIIAGNTNLNMASVEDILCPSLYNLINDILLDNGLSVNAVLTQSNPLNKGGCSIVSALPARGTVLRYAYKFLLNLTPQQWAPVSSALNSQRAISAGHVMCGSSVYYQTIDGANTAPPLTPQSSPQWLDSSAGAGTCYTDATAPLGGNQASPLPSPSPPPPTPTASPPPPPPTYQVWVSAILAGNTNLNAASVEGILCPSLYNLINDVLLDNGLSVNAVLTRSNPLDKGGCSIVSPLPASGTVLRYAYKFLLNLTPQQWAPVSSALYSQRAISAGHTMCGSSVYYQQLNGANTAPPLTPQSAPQWLDASTGAGASTCYTDATAGFHLA